MHDLESWFDVPWPPTVAHVRGLLDEVCTDAYGDFEQIGAIAQAFEDHAELPVDAVVGGRSVRFEAVEDRDVTLVARVRQPSGEPLAVPLEDLRPADGTPAAFLIAAWRVWRGLDPTVEAATGDDPGPPDLRARIEQLPRATVDELVLRLCSATAANLALVNETLGLPATRGEPALLAKCREKVGRYVAPGPDDNFQLEAALDLVEHYAAQTGDHAGEAELLVHFLSSGVRASAAYGDLFSDFYDTMAEAASRCRDLLDSDDELARRFGPAVDALVAEADPRLTETSFEDLGGFDDLDEE